MPIEKQIEIAYKKVKSMKELSEGYNLIAKSQSYPSSPSQFFSRVHISTMAIKAGGFKGELLCKSLDQSGVAFCTKIANDENAITNDVDIYHSTDGSIRLMTANNDSQVRVFDTGTSYSWRRISRFCCSSTTCGDESIDRLLAAGAEQAIDYTSEGEAASLTDRYRVAFGLPLATAILLKKQSEYRYHYGIDFVPASTTCFTECVWRAF